jgi:hypothetical protein
MLADDLLAIRKREFVATTNSQHNLKLPSVWHGGSPLRR